MYDKNFWGLPMQQRGRGNHVTKEKAHTEVHGTPITQQLQEYLEIETTGPTLPAYICCKGNLQLYNY